jgi:hypothetical protein
VYEWQPFQSNSARSDPKPDFWSKPEVWLKKAGGWKYVSDSCPKFIEVIRVVIGLVLIALHPIGLDLSFGAVAQLGERLICIQEAAGSIPTSSTSIFYEHPARRR